MTAITEAGVLDALRNIIDPDLGKDIVTLGFVKKLKIEDGAVSLMLELTTPACPIKEAFRSQAIDFIRKAYPNVDSVAVEMGAQVRGAERAQPNKADYLKTVAHPILVGSGKGGVGKSTVAINLALALAAEGAKTGLMDADAYGPSFPTMLNAHERAEPAGPNLLAPIERFGIPTMSIGYILQRDQPLIWRGPMLDSMVKQFMTQVEWGELDYLIIDLPPGTGDVQLSLAQNCPATGAVVVTTPQDVALADVNRSIAMFQHLKVPVLGIIENMSMFSCPNCGHETAIFLQGGGEKAAAQFGLPLLGKIPLVPEIPIAGDSGKPIMVSDPDGKIAQTFREVARHLAHQASLRAIQMQSL